MTQGDPAHTTGVLPLMDTGCLIRTGRVEEEESSSHSASRRTLHVWKSTMVTVEALLNASGSKPVGAVCKEDLEQHW